MEGLTLGLMPFGETIGKTLPIKSPLGVVLLIAFVGRERDLRRAGHRCLHKSCKSLTLTKPLTSTLLNEWATTLVLMVG